MNQPVPVDPNPDGRSDVADTPGLPGFRTWRTVYVFALGCFVAYIVLLAALTRAFS